MGSVTLPPLTTGIPTDLLHSAVLAVLAPWQERPGPEATFRFAVRRDDAGNIFLLHQENTDTEAPFVLAHFALRNNKIWLLRNETETDFGAALVRQGVSPAQIVPGFLPHAVRKDTGYASE